MLPLSLLHLLSLSLSLPSFQKSLGQQQQLVLFCCVLADPPRQSQDRCFKLPLAAFLQESLQDNSFIQIRDTEAEFLLRERCKYIYL